MDTQNEFKVGDMVKFKNGNPFLDGYHSKIVTKVEDNRVFYKSIAHLGGQAFTTATDLELVTASAIEGLRYNDGKPKISMVPVSAIEACAKVLMKGAEKYARDNWRKGLSYTETYDSCQRHLQKWLEGQDFDDETGEPHLAHALTNLAFLIEFDKQGVGTDDRFKGPEKVED